jgi:hypothetical protein
MTAMQQKQISFVVVRFGFICISSLITFIFTALSGFAVEPICPGGSNPDPNVIFCDDFEDNTALVRQGRYFEYDNAGGNFTLTGNSGVGNSKGMRAVWSQGATNAGHLSLAFGRNPVANQGIRSTENFREIYYRMYLKMQSGWNGDPYKLSRATIFSASDWSQAMIAHLWSGDVQYHLAIDPVRCVDANSNPVCIGYNDFTHMTWLGLQAGPTPLFDSSHANMWYCIEAHVKLNDPGQSNGIHEFWINGQLEANKSALNFVNSYSAYGINTIFFENYWNTGSTQQQERYMDNIVVSTQRIGCLAWPSPPTNLKAQ